MSDLPRELWFSISLFLSCRDLAALWASGRNVRRFVIGRAQNFAWSSVRVARWPSWSDMWPQLRRLSVSLTIPSGLPDTVRHITFKRGFQQQVNANMLPPKLLSVQFNSDYCWPLTAEVVPDSVTHLRISDYFQPWTAGVLPRSLTSVDLGYSFHDPDSRSFVNVSWPPNLTALQLNHWYVTRAPARRAFLPATLRLLDLQSFDWSSMAIVPASVTYLSFSGCLSAPSSWVQWPPNLVFLSFDRLRPDLLFDTDHPPPKHLGFLSFGPFAPFRHRALHHTQNHQQPDAYQMLVSHGWNKEAFLDLAHCLTLITGRGWTVNVSR